jgi:hypothetical protein
LRLKLPQSFRSELLDPNWSDLFIGLPREEEWEIEPENDEALGWLIADFLALHEQVLCAAAGVESIAALADPQEYVEIAEIP